jgi:hypothetical protein
MHTKAEAIATLTREDGYNIRPGDRLYTVRMNTSRSGMSHSVKVLRATADGVADISGLVSTALGRRFDDKRGGVMVGGGQIDPTFEVVYALGRTLFPDYVDTGAAGFAPYALGRTEL